MPSNNTDTWNNVPEAVYHALEEGTDEQLRVIIDYAQTLLDERPTTSIEPRDGEEIVRKEDHGYYTIVVIERSGESDDSSSRFAYRVTWEPAIEGGQGEYHWYYLGRVNTERGS